MKRKIVTVLLVIIFVLVGAVIGRMITPTKEIVKEIEVESRKPLLAKEYLLKFIDINEKISKFPYNEEPYQTTFGMRKLAGEEYQMWDELLNEVYEKIKEVIGQKEMDKLTELQLKWVEDRDIKAEIAGKKAEGGTMQPLLVTSEKANLTRQRCLELIKIYMD